MKLHHIGYLTDSIEESRSGFLLLGYVAGETTDFPAHKCKICMLYKEGEITIELVEPYQDNKSLRKQMQNGVTPYHICYEVHNIDRQIDTLIGGGYFLLSKPVPAPAFQDKLICYLWSRATGFIELVNGS